jgi:hypothetical protein
VIAGYSRAYARKKARQADETAALWGFFRKGGEVEISGIPVL